MLSWKKTRACVDVEIAFPRCRRIRSATRSTLKRPTVEFTQVIHQKKQESKHEMKPSVSWQSSASWLSSILPSFCKTVVDCCLSFWTIQPSTNQSVAQQESRLLVSDPHQFHNNQANRDNSDTPAKTNNKSAADQFENYQLYIIYCVSILFTCITV